MPSQDKTGPVTPPHSRHEIPLPKGRLDIDVVDGVVSVMLLGAGFDSLYVIPKASNAVVLVPGSQVRNAMADKRI